VQPRTQVKSLSFSYLSIYSDVLDLERWEWDEESQETWRKAGPAIQEFYKRWRDSASTDIEHEVHLGRINKLDRMPERLIVRKAYKRMFDRIWQRAFYQPESGVVVTGQPGIGE